MGKISKLFKGELKKIFLGPGIFFMAAFLILALTIAPKLFSPTAKEDISTSSSFTTTNVLSVYSSFESFKADYQTNVDELNQNIVQLIAQSANFKQNLTTLTSDIFDLRMQLNSLILNGSNEDCLNCYNSLVSNTNQLNELYSNYMQGYALPLVLVNSTLNYDIKFEISKLSKLLSKEGDLSSLDYYISLNSDLENYNCASNIKNFVSQVQNLIYSNDSLQNLINVFYTNTSLIQQKSDLLNEIETYQLHATADEEYNLNTIEINNLKNLCLKYLSIDYNAYKILNSGLYLEVSKNSTDTQMSNYVGFSNFNSYQFQENYTKYVYLLNNSYSDADFASIFSFNKSTQSITNAFDYMYFTMELASFLILAFTVIIGAGMISKEYTDGTIKLLAIRPFKRNKIILAKILATMFISFLFVLICVVVSFITGLIIYGVSFSSILLVFNSLYVFSLPNWVVFLIYIASLFIKIWIFALLAITISTIFKSYVAAVCISSFIYIINLIVTFVSHGANWLKYNIFANLDLFKYFGGSFSNSYAENQNLTNLFISPVYADTSVWFSITIISSLVFVLNLVIFSVFKHRDIT